MRRRVASAYQSCVLNLLCVRICVIVQPVCLHPKTDIRDIRVVINYDLPKSSEDYVHRIGRTGRAGDKGVAYSFFSQSQGNFKVCSGALFFVCLLSRLMLFVFKFPLVAL